MAELNPHLRAWTAALGCLATGLLGGCRNLDNAQVDVLERELRQQEDYIYELEDYLIEYSEKLRQARMAKCQHGDSTKPRGTSTTREPLPEPTLDDDPIVRPTLPLNGRNKMAPPATEAPPADSIAPPADIETPPAAPAEEPAEQVDPSELEAPELQIGPVGAVEYQNDSTAAAPEYGGVQPLLIPDPVDYQADGDAEPTSAEPPQELAESVNDPDLAAPQLNAPRLSAQELKVRRVFLEPSEDAESPGSLLVVVEGVTGADEPVDVIGAASLMVMARDAAGVLRRVDRWDFTAEETAAAWQSSHLGDGLHLELPLTDLEMPEGELELWARVVDESGAKLLTAADHPYRFEAGNLVALAEAPPEATLASSDDAPLQPIPAEPSDTSPATADADQGDAAAVKTAVSEAPQPQWRTSSIRVNDDQADGFATTAGNTSASWTTTPISGDQPRVASAPKKTNAPTWKRSTRAAAVTASNPAWAAER